MSAQLDHALHNALVRLAREDALLAFDFDGTLAALVDDPQAAALAEPTRLLLSALAAHRRCAVLSGRALDDLRARLAGLPLVALVGNHGLEVDGVPPPEALRQRVHAWGRELQGRLRGEPGVRVEDKGLSLSVHYRAAPEPGRAEASIRGAADALRDARVFGGHAVINVVPEGAPDKGAALRGLLVAAQAPAALYVGDDQTDESAFALAGEFPLLAVRVGAADVTCAQHVVVDRSGVDALLHALLEGVAQAA